MNEIERYSSEDVLKFYDPSDTNAASDVGYATLRLVKTICEAIDGDEMRLPKDGIRGEFETALRDAAKALRLHYHEDELLTVDEAMDGDSLSKILGKLFCRDGRELQVARRFDGGHP